MGCKFVLVNAPSALTPSKALRGKLEAFNQLRPKAILPPETYRSPENLEMMILSACRVLFLGSEMIRSWNKLLKIMKNMFVLLRPQI